MFKSVILSAAAAAAMAFLSVPSLCSANVDTGVVLTDIQSFSNNGGVWNNDNGSNWAIWMTNQASPATIDPSNPAAYLNNNGGSGNLPNTPVDIPVGTSSYILYKADYASTDVTDKFIFGSNVLTISPNLAYIALSSTPATGSAGPVWATGGNLVSITGFGWYAPGAFNIQNVGQGQALNNSTANDVALVTFTVTQTPEPSSMLVWGLGAIGVLLAARRRRKA